jgi:Immunoglobulin I-set domain
VDSNEDISVLNINNATVADSGNYTCTAIGQKRGSATIQVVVTGNIQAIILCT